MKLKKIFAGMAASAIAVSLMASVSASASSVSGNAGIMFQTEHYTARNEYGKEDFGPEGGPAAAFPNKCIGVDGESYGYQTDANIQDTAITGDGTYTVSIPCSGTVNAGIPTYDDGTQPTGKQLEWSLRNTWGKEEGTDADIETNVNTFFYFLEIATDIEWDSWDDEADKPKVGDKTITCKDITVEFTESGKTFTLAEAPCNSEIDYLTFQIVNRYNTDFAGVDIPADAFPTSGDMKVTFTIDGFDDDAAADSGDSSAADSTGEATPDSTSSAGDENSDAGDSSTDTSSAADETSSADASSAADTSSATTSSTAATTSTTSTTTSKAGSTTTTTTTTKSTSSTAAATTASANNTDAATTETSDATENAPAGAPQGIALALAAVALAAAVVSRKKD